MNTVREQLDAALRTLEEERLGSSLLKDSDIIKLIEKRLGKGGIDVDLKEPTLALKELNKARNGKIELQE